MRARRVFISHSAKLPAEEAVLGRLRDELKAKGWVVLLDRDELKLGVGWRHTLNLWIGACDAAVVLLSESALESTFVAYESSILSYRRRFDPSFELVPFLLAPVDRARVGASRFAPAQLEEIQWVGERIDADAGIAAIVQRLDAAVPKETPIDAVAKLVASLLESTPPPIVEQELARLRADVDVWLPDEQKPKRLAYALLEAGLQRGHETFMVLASWLPEPSMTSVRDLIEFVGASWLDGSLFARIPDAMKSQHALAMSGTKSETARMCLVRACARRPSKLWYFTSVDGVVGERTLEELLVLVRAALCDLLPCKEHELDGELRDLAALPEPVFVSLPSRGLDARTLRGLRDRLPGVTFFLLTGHPPPLPAELSAAAVTYLDPDFDSQVEGYHVAQYKAKLRLLLQERSP